MLTKEANLNKLDGLDDDFDGDMICFRKYIRMLTDFKGSGQDTGND